MSVSPSEFNDPFLPTPSQEDLGLETEKATPILSKHLLPAFLASNFGKTLKNAQGVVVFLKDKIVPTKAQSGRESMMRQDRMVLFFFHNSFNSLEVTSLSPHKRALKQDIPPSMNCIIS